MESNVLKEYAVKFAEDEAKNLHDEIVRLCGEAGINEAVDRSSLNIPTIYGLVDDLFKNGFGSASTT
jgi:hypothetical protein